MIAGKTESNRPRPPPEECNQVGLDNAIWDMMEECWRTDAADRPTACDLVRTLTLQLRARGSEVPDVRWNDSVVELRSTLVQDPRSIQIFSKGMSLRIGYTI